MAILLKIDGTRETILPKNGKCFEIEELQKCVGGLVEYVRLNDNETMAINEEGKLIGLEVNDAANEIAERHSAIFFWDFIVGDVVICQNSELE